jgi:2-iminobutanoate/2-iminopropanoate deaminase
MPITQHNPTDLFPAYRSYAHAVEVPAGARTLYISGFNGYEADGVTIPSDFTGQAQLVWRHLGTVLGSADMGYADLVCLRFFLASAADDPTNVEILSEHLGHHVCARTVVVQSLLEPSCWSRSRPLPRSSTDRSKGAARRVAGTIQQRLSAASEAPAGAETRYCPRA